MQLKNWQASNRPQQKSKKTPQKYRQWLDAHKLLVERLKKGINYPDPTGSFLLA